jgi:hypothetical protein
VVGIVVLVAPLVLLAIAIPFWWLAPGFDVSPPASVRQPSQRAMTRIGGSDFEHSTNGHVTFSRTDSVERHGAFAAAAAPAVSVPKLAVLFVLLPIALLLLGGMVALFAFRKTRAAGIAILAVASLAIGVLFYRLAPMPSASGPAVSATIADDARVGAGIPVDTTEGVITPNPAVKPAVTTIGATGRAFIKAITEGSAKLTAEKADAKPVAVPKKGPPLLAARAPVEAATRKAEALTPMADAKLAPAQGKPDWVDAPPRMVGDAYQMAIVLGPWPTRRECEADLPKELQKALDRYAEMCLGEPVGGSVALPYDFLRQEVVKEQWEEEVQSPSVGRMTQLHVLLRFDHKVKDRILEEQQRGIVTSRLWMGGAGLAAVLWLLGVLYGYLRIDLATGGAYRGRLRFAAALAILGPVAAALLVVA